MKLPPQPCPRTRKLPVMAILEETEGLSNINNIIESPKRTIYLHASAGRKFRVKLPLQKCSPFMAWTRQKELMFVYILEIMRCPRDITFSESPQCRASCISQGETHQQPPFVPPCLLDAIQLSIGLPQNVLGYSDQSRYTCTQSNPSSKFHPTISFSTGHEKVVIQMPRV